LNSLKNNISVRKKTPWGISKRRSFLSTKIFLDKILV
jgi:hypothetical protein